MNKAARNLFIAAKSSCEVVASPVARPPGLFPLIVKRAIIDPALTRFEEARFEKLAYSAYRRRDLAAMQVASEALLRLPSQSSQATGLYYSALALKRRGAIDQSRALLELISSHPTIEARALLSLGACYLIEGQYDEAFRLYVEATKAGSYQEKLAALWNISELKSIAGDHQSALEDLSNLWPLVRIAANSENYYLACWHNEMAVELAAIGNLREASEHSRIAMSSPLALAYPEWQATHTELEELLARPVQVVVAIPAPEPETESVRVALVTTGDIRSQNAVSIPITRASLEPLVLVKSFIISHPARAPPTAKP